MASQNENKACTAVLYSLFLYSMITALSFSVGILAAPVDVLADIYKYIDSNGVLHFTNVPVSSGYQLYIKEKPEKSAAPRITNKYDDYIKRAAVKFGLSFSLIKAMIQVESNFNPRAISRKGAKGLMQIMPHNFGDLNIKNPFNPHENIMGGARYFKQMLDRYSGKLPLALAAYNAGPSAVDRYKRIPPYPETEQYVKNVMEIFNTMNR